MLWVMRAVVCAFVLAACSTNSAYKCTASDQCVSHGTAGTCEQSYCAFPDPSCASGLRFEPNAGGGLANTCANALTVDAPLADAAAPDVAPVAIAFVQQNASSAGTATTLAVPYSAALVTAHDTLIVGVDGNSAGTATVTDSLGNTFAPVVGPIENGGLRMTIFAAFDVAGGPDTVTVTLSSAPASFFEVYIHEYAGLVAFDAEAAQVGTSTATDAMASGNADTHFGNELIFGYGVTGSSVAGTSFNTRSSFHSNITEDMIVTTAGTYQATATMTAGSGWTMLMATFRGY